MGEPGTPSAIMGSSAVVPAADMVFSPAEIVSRLSHDMTLEPGDLITCGTSLGVLPMKAGNTVEVEIDGVGVLHNRFEATLEDGQQ